GKSHRGNGREDDAGGRPSGTTFSVFVSRLWRRSVGDSRRRLCSFPLQSRSCVFTRVDAGVTERRAGTSALVGAQDSGRECPHVETTVQLRARAWPHMDVGALRGTRKRCPRTR